MGKARFSLRVLVPPRLSSHSRPHTTAPDEFALAVFSFPSDCCHGLLTWPKSHQAWGPRLGGVSADRRLTGSCLSVSPQVLYNVFESFVTLGGDKVTGVDCVKGIGVWLAAGVPAGSQGQCLLRNMNPVGQHLCQAGTHSLCRETRFHFKVLVTGPRPPRQVTLIWFPRPQPPWVARIIAPTDPREHVDPVSGVLGIPLGRDSYRWHSWEPRAWSLLSTPHQCCWSQRCPRSGVARPPLVQCSPLPMEPEPLSAERISLLFAELLVPLGSPGTSMGNSQSVRPARPRRGHRGPLRGQRHSLSLQCPSSW